MRKLSIRYRIIILTLIPFIAFTMLQAINIKESFDRSIEQKFQESEALGRTIAKSFVNYIEELLEQELIISKQIIKDINNINDIQTYLEEILSTDETTIERLSFIDRNGVIAASITRNVIGKSVVNHEYYKRIVNGEDKVVNDLIKKYEKGCVVFPVSS